MVRLSTFWLLLPLALQGDATTTSTRSSTQSSTHSVSNNHTSTSHKTSTSVRSSSVRLGTGPAVSVSNTKTSSIHLNGTTTSKQSALTKSSSVPVVTIKTTSASRNGTVTPKSSGTKSTAPHSSSSVHEVSSSRNSTSTASKPPKSSGTHLSTSAKASTASSSSKRSSSLSNSSKPSSSKSESSQSTGKKSSTSKAVTNTKATTTGPKATTTGKATAPFTFSGTWSDAPASSPSPFNWFSAPTKTIPAPAATSEAVLLGGLFLALQSNRHWVTDPKLKSQYIDNIKKTKDETTALFNSLDVKPPAAPDCSSTSRKRNVMSEKQLRSLIAKRGLLSGITDLAKDAVNEVAGLISCAEKVVDNLIDNVDIEDPKIDIIETLTDGLAEIGEDLKKADENKDDNTKTDSKPTSTEKEKSSTSSQSKSTSSCTGDRTVPVCTKTISLSTSFLSGGTSSTVATITSTACKTTTISGCTAAGTTATTVISTSGAACTAFSVPTDDDPEEDGVEVDANSYKKRSIAGRIALEPRADRAPSRFGDCPIPGGFALSIPGIPSANQVFTKDVPAPAATDAALLSGVARYFDRNVNCDGTTKMQKHAQGDLTNNAKQKKAQGLNVADYSMDHVWELKFLLQFFQTITPPTSNDVFTDCGNFNKVFFPATCNNVMQKLYDQVPTNADTAGGNQIEFAIMLKDLNNKKGVIFKPNEFTNSFWVKKNLGTVKQNLVTMQDVSVAMAICQDSSVVPLFDKTNLRIYNAFQGIDNLVATNSIDLKDKTFKFADAYENWMKGYLPAQAAAAWKFIDSTMSDTQKLIDAMDDGADKTTAQTQLDNFKNGDLGKQAHYSFSFKTALAGGSAISMKRSISLFERDSCPVKSGSPSSASGSASQSTPHASTGTHSGSASKASSKASSVAQHTTSGPPKSSSVAQHTTSVAPKSSSVAPKSSSKPAPPTTKPSPKPSPTPQPKMTCNGIDNNKWLDPNDLADNIKSFCADASKQGVQDKNSGSISRVYDEVSLGIDWPSGAPFPGESDCNKYMTDLMNNCDGNDPNNPMNWKHGGLWDLGVIKYHVNPTKEKYFAGSCGFHVHEIEHFHGVDGPGTERVHSFTTKVTAKDSKGNVLYTSDDESASDSTPYKMENVYYNALVLIPEAQGGDYIQFNLGDQSWTTKDNGAQGQKCTVGGWDGDYTPVGRDMDCVMQC